MALSTISITAMENVSEAKASGSTAPSAIPDLNSGSIVSR